MCTNVENLKLKKIWCKVFSVIEAYDLLLHGLIWSCHGQTVQLTSTIPSRCQKISWWHGITHATRKLKILLVLPFTQKTLDPFWLRSTDVEWEKRRNWPMTSDMRDWFCLRPSWTSFLITKVPRGDFQSIGIFPEWQIHEKLPHSIVSKNNGFALLWALRASFYWLPGFQSCVQNNITTQRLKQKSLRVILKFQ